nr:MAG TPA: hypothetical protein [Caudoviricetes sp.]
MIFKILALHLQSQFILFVGENDTPVSGDFSLIFAPLFF